MCIEDNSTTDSKGALCAEANIDGQVFAVKTWTIPAADIGKLDDAYTLINAGSTYDYLQNLRFNTTTTSTDDAAISDPVISEITDNVKETDSTIREFTGFGVLNCSLTSSTMDCINWVRSETGAADGGYPRWAESTPVTFWWFDARNLSSAVHAFNKIKTVDVNLVYDSDSAIA